MEKRETNAMKALRSGLCFILMAGMAACNGGTEVAETEEATEEVAVADTWDREEYYTTFASTNYYEDWDLNDDNFLDEGEFTTSFYTTWDTDNDGAIEETEWTTVVADYNLDDADWATWDADGDGLLEEEEFNTGFANYGWYDTWDVDKDNLVAEREYTDSLFGIWDENDDDVLDDREYVYYTTYYGV